MLADFHLMRKNVVNIHGPKNCEDVASCTVLGLLSQLIINAFSLFLFLYKKGGRFAWMNKCMRFDYYKITPWKEEQEKVEEEKEEAEEEEEEEEEW